MSKKLTYLFFLATAILLIGFIFINSPSKIAMAGTGENVYGWAWSENIGWLSFNNTSGGGTTSYGVNINPATGLFSGYAWSENLAALSSSNNGWISFAPVAPYPATPSYAACVDLPGITTEPCNGIGSYNVGGWVRALAYGGGWDGWIKLRGTTGLGSPYGVSIDTSVTPYQFRGWAWGGDDTAGAEVVGWISFNCSNQSVCGTSNYKVMTNLNAPPTPSSVVITGTSYCNILPGVGQVAFQWTYNDIDGDSQSQYHLQIATDAAFTSLKVDSTNSQAVSPGGTGTSAVQVKESPTPSTADLDIGYGSTYYWRLRVKDTFGNWSSFVNGTPVSFTSPAHGYPWINFSWAPQSPATNEQVQFADQSLVFGLGVIKSSWLWEFTDWTFATGYSPVSQNPLGAFTSPGDKRIYLTVTDSTGFVCRNYRDVTAELPLPEWKEIAPF